jgi:hypothetical protein
MLTEHVCKGTRQRWAGEVTSVLSITNSVEIIMGWLIDSSLKYPLVCGPELKGKKTQDEDRQCSIINVKFRRVRIFLPW